jgi:histidine triad (HIT) family protein
MEKCMPTIQANIDALRPDPIVIIPMTEEARAQRRDIGQRCATLIEQGICPSCQQFLTGEVFPYQGDTTYYEDAFVSLHLEAYPRGTGHTIIVAKPHFADIADMPLEFGYHMTRITHAAVNVLKEVVEAEKVYMVTMCSGAMSHLHYQLIPRLKGEMIGGHVFASARGVLTNYEVTRTALEKAMRRRVENSATASPESHT